MTFPVVNDDILFIKGGICVSNRSETELSYNRRDTASNVDREHYLCMQYCYSAEFLEAFKVASKCITCITKWCGNPQNAYANKKLYCAPVVSWRMNVNKNISLVAKRIRFAQSNTRSNLSLMMVIRVQNPISDKHSQFQ